MSSVPTTPLVTLTLERIETIGIVRRSPENSGGATTG